MQRLEHDSMLAIYWFESDYMKLNNEKCHLLLSDYKPEVTWANLASAKYGKARNKNFLASLLIGA